MHDHWMRICLQLAREAMLAGDAPVGSVVVKDGIILGEGRETGKTKKDITCHAEIEAIRDAIQNGFTNLSQTTLYTTHEPCIMCSYVIRHHQIPLVIISKEVAEIGGYTSAYPILKVNDISRWGQPPKVLIGLLREECALLEQEFRDKKV